MISVAALIATALFTAFGVLVSLHRFWQYEVFYYDFGIFASALWNASRFHAPVIDHLVVGGKWIFADHFNPSIFLLTPLFWFTSRMEVLLLAQAVMVGMSGWMVYVTARHILGKGLEALTAPVLFFLFVGIQNAVITDFHEVTVMTLPVAICLWAIVTKKKRWYWVSLIVLLAGKESMFTVGLGIAAFLFLSGHTWKREALLTGCVSLVWGWMSTTIIIPYFSEGRFQYAPALRPGVIANLLAFVDEPVKRKTLWYSLVSFGFLPLLAPSAWPLLIIDLVVRFIPENTDLRWDLGLHYNAIWAILLAFASIVGLRYYQRRLRSKRALTGVSLLIMSLALVVYAKILHGPLALAYNPAFYRHTSDFRFLDDLVAAVPADGTVMTQNNLAVRFIPQGVWLLRENYQKFGPTYIVLDLRDGQNPNNFFGSGDAASIYTMVTSDHRYEEYYRAGDQYIFRFRSPDAD